MVNLSVNIAGIEMKNPLTVGSGTLNLDYKELYSLDILGAYTPKTIRSYFWPGNPPPRIAEIPAGVLTSVGIPSKEWQDYVEQDVPKLRSLATPVIVSVVGRTVDEYVEIIEQVNGLGFAAALELNLSCPNLKAGGSQFGSDARAATEIIRRGKLKTNLPIIPKLPPDFANIVHVAKAAEAAGADALSMINGPRGMVIDINTKKPVLGNKIGGLGGPCIKAIAVGMIYDVYQQVDIPIIGMGGISSATDVLEFMMAGARAVALGTVNFFEPLAVPYVLRDLEAYLKENDIEDINLLVGVANER